VPCGGIGRCLSATLWLILAHTQRPNRHAPATNNPATANPILAAAAAHGRVSIPGSFGCIIRSSSLHLLLASSHSSVHPYFSAHAHPCRADLTTASASAVSKAADLRHPPYPAARPSKLPKHDDASSCRGPGSPPRRCARRRATADVAHAQVSRDAWEAHGRPEVLVRVCQSYCRPRASSALLSSPPKWRHRC
jgi:hypothetical protein